MEQNNVPYLPPEIIRMVMKWVWYQMKVDDSPYDHRNWSWRSREYLATLHSAVLVNKVWSAEAIRVLWNTPPVSALAAIKNRDRRQFYARHAQKLQIYSPKFDFDRRTREPLLGMEKRIDEYSTLRDLELPQLKWIDIDIKFCEKAEFNYLRLCMEPCIRPNLKEAKIFVDYSDAGEGVGEEIFHLLQKQCPQIKKIRELDDRFLPEMYAHVNDMLDISERKK